MVAPAQGAPTRGLLASACRLRGSTWHSNAARPLEAGAAARAARPRHEARERHAVPRRSACFCSDSHAALRTQCQHWLPRPPGLCAPADHLTASGGPSHRPHAQIQKSSRPGGGWLAAKVTHTQGFLARGPSCAWPCGGGQLGMRWLHCEVHGAQGSAAATALSGRAVVTIT